MSKTLNLQISKWGNSLAMRIPSGLARQMGLQEGGRVSAQLTADGGLKLRSAGWSRKGFASELEAARQAMPLGEPVMDELRQSARY